MHALKKKIKNLSLAIFSHKYKNISSMFPYLDMSAELAVLAPSTFISLHFTKQSSGNQFLTVSYSLFSF